MLPIPDDADAKEALGPKLSADEFLLSTEDNNKFDTVTIAAIDPYPAIGELVWKFDKTAEYVPDTKIFMETPTQQFLRKDATNGTDDYKVTSPATEKLKPAPRVDASTAPWPGVAASHRIHDGGQNLRKPTGKKGLNLFAKTDLRAQSYSLRFLKRAATYE